jgi:cytochrome b561
MKSKSQINFLIDALLFLNMMALLGTGYVRKYVLLSGSASRASYGYKVHSTLLGWNRQQWSDIHLYLAYSILFLLCLHIVLHWKQIRIMYKNLIKDSFTRRVIMAIFILLALFLALFPFIIPAQLY